MYLFTICISFHASKACKFLQQKMINTNLHKNMIKLLCKSRVKNKVFETNTLKCSKNDAMDFSVYCQD